MSTLLPHSKRPRPGHQLEGKHAHAWLVSKRRVALGPKRGPWPDAKRTRGNAWKTACVQAESGPRPEAWQSVMPENASTKAGLPMIRGFALNICAKPALGKMQTTALAPHSPSASVLARDTNRKSACSS